MLCHSDGIPEIFFFEVNFEKKKNTADNKKMQNFPEFYMRDLISILPSNKRCIAGA